MSKIKVDLNGPPQTMLATLYAKALDAERQRPILGDVWARDAVAHIDYDWTKTTITDRTSPSVTTRSLHFDIWARQFLACHERAVVLHLGAGLDSRVYRLDPGPGIEWYDVDYPSIMELREQIYPARPHYHRIAASVTDPGWLDQIPADRPVLALSEGLTMYLTESDGIALLRRIVAHFPSGELQFDAFNRFGIRSQWVNSVVRRSGSTLHWGIDGPSEIVTAVPGVRLLAWVSPFESESFRGVSREYRIMARVMSWVPALKTMAQYHRYAF
ncbi:Tetracenomycin polyketide synthesis O-methyltransferase TcmP [uncultured Mycobacterium sp.]|uniref:Tetracenomycin polyketide synthesis O-methyltransferase TcmP n=1 Tax=uncultured Mycobacterium sp. TaxID=171292 RepID=A0A1Y5P9X5_9MYCO|nr:Tetracenomycin polyketide synthesis O-methyltransferase TcmP [uncultured Mycobacterium sp.]